MLKQSMICVLGLALLSSTASADNHDKRSKRMSCAAGLIWIAGVCAAAAGHPEVGKAAQDTGSKAVKSIGDGKEQREKVKRERLKDQGAQGAGGKPPRQGRGDRDRVSSSKQRPPKVTKKPITKPQRITPQRSPKPPFKRR
jgi:hypothetical protein